MTHRQRFAPRTSYSCLFGKHVCTRVTTSYLDICDSLHDYCDLLHQEEDLEPVAIRGEMMSSHSTKVTLLRTFFLIL